MKLKNLYLMLFLTVYLISGCSSKQIDSKVLESAGAGETGTTVNTGVVVNGDAQTANEYLSFLWHGDRRVDLQKCGTAQASDRCNNLEKAGTAECMQEFRTVQEINLKAGFYYRRENANTFCAHRCRQEKPSCRGAECIGDWLSYSLKKFAEVTEICTATCRLGIDQKTILPLECHNLNENPLYVEAKKKADDNLKKIQSDPKYAALVQKNEALKAKIKQTKARIERLKQAEIDFDSYVRDVHIPTLKIQVYKLKDLDNQILDKIHLDGTRLLNREQQLYSVQNNILSGKFTLSDVDSHRSILNSFRDTACDVPSYSSEVSQRTELLRGLNEIYDKLQVKGDAVENPALTESLKSGRIKFIPTVTPKEIPQELAAGATSRRLCEHFTQVDKANEVAAQILSGASVAAGLGDILKSLEPVFFERERSKLELLFHKNVLASLDRGIESLRISRQNNQYTRAQRISVSLVKILHQSVLPAVEINEILTPEFKTRLKELATKRVYDEVKLWNSFRQSFGDHKVVLAHVGDVATKLRVMQALIKKLSPSARKNWSEEWQKSRAQFDSVLTEDGLTFVDASSLSISDLVMFDEKLSELHTLINEMCVKLKAVPL